MSDRLSDAALDKLLAYRACSHERKCLDVSPGDPFGWCPDCVVTALVSEVRASRANGGGDGEVEPLIAEAFKRAVDPKYVRHIDPEYLTGDALAFLLARAIRFAPSVPASPACPQCNNAGTVYSPNEGEIPCGTCERARLRGAVASPPAPVEPHACSSRTDCAAECMDGPGPFSPPTSAPVEDAPDYVPACECGKPTPLGLLCLACASAKDVTPDGCAPVEDARPEFPRAPVDDVEREAISSTRPRSLGGSSCSERRPCGVPFGCTRVAGHSGDHAASDGRSVLARWPGRPPSSPAAERGHQMITRDHGWIRFGEGSERWSAPDPQDDERGEAMHAARYDLAGMTQTQAFQLAEMAEAYCYLLATCPTTALAIEKVREIRRTVREAPPSEDTGAGKGGES